MDYILESNNCFSTLSQEEYYAISGGSVWDGLATIVQGATTFIAGAALMTAASSVSGTSVGAAVTILVAGTCGIGAMVIGAVAVGYGVYQMFK